MSQMTMGMEARTLKRGDHLIGEAAGEIISGVVTLADPVTIEPELEVVHFNVLDDLGVLWDFFESAETVMVVTVWVDGDDDE